MVAIMVLSLLAPAAGSVFVPTLNLTLSTLGIYNSTATALSAFGISSSTADTYYSVDLGCSRTIVCNSRYAKNLRHIDPVRVKGLTGYQSYDLACDMHFPLISDDDKMETFKLVINCALFDPTGDINLIATMARPGGGSGDSRGKSEGAGHGITNRYLPLQHDELRLFETFEVDLKLQKSLWKSIRVSNCGWWCVTYDSLRRSSADQLTPNLLNENSNFSARERPLGMPTFSDATIKRWEKNDLPGICVSWRASRVEWDSLWACWNPVPGRELPNYHQTHPGLPIRRVQHKCRVAANTKSIGVLFMSIGCRRLCSAAS
eukprot:933292-Rhodomonas_salina.2